MWNGSFAAHGRRVYCMDLGAVGPWNDTHPPELQTILDSLPRQQLAEQNYAMGRWGESHDPNVTSAIPLSVWDVANHDAYIDKGGDRVLIQRVLADQLATALANLAMMRDTAAQMAAPIRRYRSRSACRPHTRACSRSAGTHRRSRVR